MTGGYVATHSAIKRPSSKWQNVVNPHPTSKYSKASHVDVRMCDMLFPFCRVLPFPVSAFDAKDVDLAQERFHSCKLAENGLQR